MILYFDFEFLRTFLKKFDLILFLENPFIILFLFSNHFNVTKLNNEIEFCRKSFFTLIIFDIKRTDDESGL